MGDHKREAVSFLTNESVAVALEKTAPFQSAYSKWGYWLTGDRIMFVPQVASVLIGNLDPQPGEEFCVTKREVRNGKGKPRIEWLVTQQPVIASHQPAPNGKPSNVQAAAEATGIPMSQLEQQVQDSVEAQRRKAEHKAVQEKAAASIRAKLALEQSGQAVPETAPEPVEPARKPVAIETVSPAPAAPELAPMPERPIWQPNLVEVTRSWTYKLDGRQFGIQFENREFFCCQKAECRPEDAELLAKRLHAFCKRQVLDDVADYLREIGQPARRLA